jgi:hypothetical protein
MLGVVYGLTGKFQLVDTHDMKDAEDGFALVVRFFFLFRLAFVA